MDDLTPSPGFLSNALKPFACKSAITIAAAANASVIWADVTCYLNADSMMLNKPSTLGGFVCLVIGGILVVLCVAQIAYWSAWARVTFYRRREEITTTPEVVTAVGVRELSEDELIPI